jgi:hypothetical protein
MEIEEHCTFQPKANSLNSPPFILPYSERSYSNGRTRSSAAADTGETATAAYPLHSPARSFASSLHMSHINSEGYPTDQQEGYLSLGGGSTSGRNAQSPIHQRLSSPSKSYSIYRTALQKSAVEVNYIYIYRH